DVRRLRPAAGPDGGPAGPHLGGPHPAAAVRPVVRGGGSHPERVLRPRPDPVERHPPLDAAPGARRRRRPPLPPPSPEAQAPADLVAAGEPGPPPPDAATANGRPEGRPSTSGSPGRRLAAPVDDQKSSMPPGIAGACSFSGLSAMTASVVRKRPAIEAAFCSAERVTLAASMMPALVRSSYSPVAALRPSVGLSRCRTRSTTTPPSRPALMAICLSGSSSASATI